MATNENESSDVVQWFYKIEDVVHGPFSASQMMKWLGAGYFPDYLLIRTQNDQDFHLLSDFTAALGNCPFATNSASLSFSSASNSQRGGDDAEPPASDSVQPAITRSSSNDLMDQQREHWMRMNMALAATAMRLQQNPPPPAGPMMFNPAAFPHPAFGPTIPFMPTIPVVSQIPPPGVLQSTTTEKPPSREVGTETHPIAVCQDAGSQTAPLQISADEAARLLSYMLGKRVILSSSNNKNNRPIKKSV